MSAAPGLRRRVTPPAAFLLAILLAGCAVLQPAPPPPTLIPADILPTVIAQTAQAAAPARPTESPAPPASPTPTPAITASATPSPTPPNTTTPTASRTPAGSPSPSARARFATRTPSPTPTPDVPPGEVEILNLGHLSRVTSPVPLTLYVKTRPGGSLRIELLGEDRRSLARELRSLRGYNPGAWTQLNLELLFEIAAPGEAGRLVVTVSDEYGRPAALNSVALILLSVGQADILAPADYLSPIVIRQPTLRRLVQGGKLTVSGLARPVNDQPLVIQLIAQDGRVLGQRLAALGDELDNQGYAAFETEVSYSAPRLTPVLVVVSQGDPRLEDLVALASVEVPLAP